MYVHNGKYYQKYFSEEQLLQWPFYSLSKLQLRRINGKRFLCTFTHLSLTSSPLQSCHFVSNNSRITLYKNKEFLSNSNSVSPVCYRLSYLSIYNWTKILFLSCLYSKILVHHSSEISNKISLSKSRKEQLIEDLFQFFFIRREFLTFINRKEKLKLSKI